MPRVVGVTLLHRTHKVGEVSGCRVSKAGGKRLFPGSGDLLMQITEKRQLPPFRFGIWAAKEPLVEFRRKSANPARASQWRVKARPRAQSRPLKAAPPGR